MLCLLQTADPKARNGVQSISTKRRKDQSKNSGTEQDASSESFSMFSSKSFAPEKDSEELMALREQIADLQRKLSEKEELLKSLEISKVEMDAILEKLDEIKTEAAEKDSLLNSTQMQLSDLKVYIAIYLLLPSFPLLAFSASISYQLFTVRLNMHLSFSI